MAKKIDISKKLKISKAQQNMLGAVLASGMILGVCVVLAIYFVKYIKFNAIVIGEKDKSIDSYTKMISSVGACPKPRGKNYSESELLSCQPNNIKLSDDSVKGSLRSQILVDMAQNESLESVGRDTLSICYDESKTPREKYSYDFWYNKMYNAPSEELRQYYLNLFGICSALRAVPDALPAAKNELALMASLDKIFEISNWTPTSLAPGDQAQSTVDGLGAIQVNLVVDADTGNNTTQTVLSNIEKSIRDFEINTASIEWIGTGQITLTARATSYFTEEVGLKEYTKSVKGDGKITTTEGLESEEEEDL